MRTFANENQPDGLLRLEREITGVTTKTLMFGVCYLPPSAVKRYTRSVSLVKAIQHHSTPSFCKYEPLYKTREEAQARCDKRNAAEFGGEPFLHVIERWAVPPVERKPISEEQLERELKADFDADCETLGRAAAEESNAFARRVLGLD